MRRRVQRREIGASGLNQLIDFTVAPRRVTSSPFVNRITFVSTHTDIMKTGRWIDCETSEQGRSECAYCGGYQSMACVSTSVQQQWVYISYFTKFIWSTRER